MLMFLNRLCHNSNPLVTLTNSRLQSTANGTTSVSRLLSVMLISGMIFLVLIAVRSHKVSIPIVTHFYVIKRASLQNSPKTDAFIYSSPGQTFFVCVTIFLWIPLAWILFNPELRAYIWRKFLQNLGDKFQLQRNRRVEPEHLFL